MAFIFCQILQLLNLKNYSDINTVSYYERVGQGYIGQGTKTTPRFENREHVIGAALGIHQDKSM